MGQAIEVEASAIGDVAVFDTDRSISGQDGEQFSASDEAEASQTFPGLLARKLFEADDAVGHVFAASNTITVKRNGGWDDASLGAISSVIEDFFLFYRE